MKLRQQKSPEQGKQQSQGIGSGEQLPEAVVGAHVPESDKKPSVNEHVFAQQWGPSRPKSAQDLSRERKRRKNAQARARSAQLRGVISQVKDKCSEDMTEEEMQLLDSYEVRRRRKNDRSRERSMEQKAEFERILAKPERTRTKQEKDFVETITRRKQRKNKGDRVRRRRTKMRPLGLPAERVSSGKGASALGTVPQHAAFATGMPDNPTPPFPTSVPTPPPSAFASPHLFSYSTFPYPHNTRPSSTAGTPGVLGTPSPPIPSVDPGSGTSNVPWHSMPRTTFYDQQWNARPSSTAGTPSILETPGSPASSVDPGHGTSNIPWYSMPRAAFCAKQRNSMCERPQKDKETKDDCLVPKGNKEDHILEASAATPPSNNDSLPPKRFQGLQSTGKIEQHHPWDVMCERLEKYKAEMGDCLVPRTYEKDQTLANWVDRQRSNKDNLSVEEIQRLEAIGFVWSIFEI